MTTRVVDYNDIHDIDIEWGKHLTNEAIIAHLLRLIDSRAPRTVFEHSQRDALLNEVRHRLEGGIR